MPKFTVHLMSVYVTYEGVEAATKEEAIAKCEFPSFFDMNEPASWLAIEEDDDE